MSTVARKIAPLAHGEVAALTMASAAHATEFELKFLGTNVSGDVFANTTGAYIDRGVPAASSPLSHNQDNARELWQASTTMTGLRPTETIFRTADTH